MNLLGPLKFTPIYKERIWGGKKLTELYKNTELSDALIGEVWLLSGVEGDETYVCDGPLAENSLNELVEIFMSDLVGESVYEKYGDEFPILVKMLDANDYLSIQVHPNDELAQARLLSQGKTEMWYVLEAESNAELITGFKTKIEKTQFVDLLANKNLLSVLNKEKVYKGDVFFIPAGRIHALGPGILLAEIQQTSDTTYRVYDWDRVDANGKSRELHLADSLDAIDFEVYDSYKSQVTTKKNDTSILVDCPQFTTNKLFFDRGIKKNYEEIDSFIILLATKGSFTLKHAGNSFEVKQGECILVPAIVDEIELFPKLEAELLEIYIKESND